MAKGSGGTRVTSTIVSARMKIAEAIREFDENGYITIPPINVGKVDATIKKYAQDAGDPLVSDDMYFTGSAIIHALRDTKAAAGISVENNSLSDFPSAKNRMEIYYDRETGNYTYTDGINKFVVRPNARIKLARGREKVVSLVTASKMRSDGYTEFGMGKYEKIK